MRAVLLLIIMNF